MSVLTVVSAGLRDPSSTRLLADRIAVAAERELRAAGGRPADDAADAVEVRHVEVRRHAHAIADALLTGFPTGTLKEALADVAAADSLVLVTPTFQGSYSGLFKSFLDLVDADEVGGTPVLLAATGGSERHSLVVENALRPLAAYLGLLAVPTGVYAATADFGGTGTAALSRRIDRAARELAGLRARVPRATSEPVIGISGAFSNVEQQQDSTFTPFEQLLGSIGT